MNGKDTGRDPPRTSTPSGARPIASRSWRIRRDRPGGSDQGGIARVKAPALPLSLQGGEALSELSSLIGRESDPVRWLPKRDATRREWLLYTRRHPQLPADLLDEALNDALGNDDDDEDDEGDE